MAVEAIELVVTALTAGAAVGMKDTATAAVKDAYTALVAGVRRRLSRQGAAGAELIDRHAIDPGGYRDALVAALTSANAADDEGILAAAQDLMAHIDPRGPQAGKYTIDVRDANGVQIGDGNTMNITF
jgi:hypothetical protein